MTRAPTDEVEIRRQSEGPVEDPSAGSPGVRLRTVIQPRQGWRLINLRELWTYRELLYFLAVRDVKVRYKQTLLGGAWAILQPFLMMVVFTVFLGRMAHVSSGDFPYPLFVYAGLLPWSFFASAVANAGNSVVGSERLITKIYFPRLSIPFAAVGAAMIDFCIALVVLVAMMAWYRVPPGPWLVLAPFVLALVACAALGVGTLLAALNVAYRDFRYVIPFLLQLWMFATPTVYMATSADESDDDATVVAATTAEAPRSDSSGAKVPGPRDPGVPGYVRGVLKLNPLTGLIGVFRAAMLGGPLSFQRLAFSAAGALAFLIGGCLYFRRVEDSFADVI
jgi:lipopolysaccharide transport system permease protein